MKFPPRMGLSTGRGILVLIAAPALAGLVTVQPAHALAPPLLPHLPPASLYPAGTKMVVTDPLSNFQKSCAWDLNCSDGATPHTHSTDEDALGRLGGWMVFARWNGRHSRQMTFILFGSAYDTAAHAQAAAADYQAQLTSPRFQMKHFPCPLSVTAVDSHTFCARYHDRSLIGVAPMQWRVYDLVRGQGDVVSIPPLVTTVGHGYHPQVGTRGLLEGKREARGAGRPGTLRVTHTPCYCDDCSSFMLLPQ